MIINRINDEWWFLPISISLSLSHTFFSLYPSLSLSLYLSLSLSLFLSLSQGSISKKEEDGEEEEGMEEHVEQEGCPDENDFNKYVLISIM